MAKHDFLYIKNIISKNADFSEKQIISRDDARASGLKRFFTGIPCVSGHIDERRVRDGVCYQCERNHEWRARNRKKPCVRQQSLSELDRAIQNRIQASARRFLVVNAEGKHTRKQVMDLLNEQSGKCATCATHLTKWHIDHKAPLSRGGSNDISNIQILCKQCNLLKGSLMQDEWMIKFRNLQNA